MNLFAFALGVVVKATLLLLGAGVLTLLLRRGSAATRHLVWTGTLAGLLALPPLALGLPGLGVPLPALPTTEPAISAPAPASAADVRVGVPAAPSPVPLETPSNMPVAENSPGRTPLSPVTMLLGLWLLGAAAVLGRLLLGRWGLRRLARRAQPVTDPAWTALLHDAAWLLDVPRPVRLLRSDGATMPMTWGTRRPVVLLPAEADAWPKGRRRSTLLHELAHVARRDCLTQSLAALACAVYWFHPGVWLAAARLRGERERACDDRVLAAGMRPADYAAHLLDAARAFRTGGLLAPAAVAMARPSQLEGRLLAVLDGARNRRSPGPRGLAGGMGMMLVLILPLAAMRPTVAEPEGIGAEVFAPRALPAAPAPAESPPRVTTGLAATDVAADPFRWSGVLAPGQTLGIRGVSGPITALPASGREVEVVAERRQGRRGDPEQVRFQVARSADGVTICALYPSGDSARPNRCTPGPDATWNVNVRDNDTEVRWTVRIPAGVGLNARNVNGAVEANGLAGDVNASTVNGAVRISTSGSAQASTVNGDVVARLGRLDGRESLGFVTVNGDIRVSLPAKANAQIRASTTSGHISTDFPLTVRKNGWVGQTVNGTLGRGGVEIELTNVNGEIRLQSRGGGAASRPAAEQVPELVLETPARVQSARRLTAPRAPPAPRRVRQAPGDDWGLGELVSSVVETSLRATSEALAVSSEALAEANLDSTIAVATASATREELAQVDQEQIRQDIRREMEQERPRIERETREVEQARRRVREDATGARREALLGVIRSAREADSDAERAALLGAVARQPGFDDPAVRRAWDRAVRQIASERERRRALEARP